MNEDEAGFTFKLARGIFNLVHEMLPKAEIARRRLEDEKDGQGGDQSMDKEGKEKEFTESTKRK